MNYIIQNKTGLAAVLNTMGAAVEGLYFKGICIGTKGSIKGRVANRLAGAAFTLNGKKYKVSANKGADQLHGGFVGFSEQQWTCTERSENSAVFRLSSPDGQEGYPGTLHIKVRYTIAENDALRIEFFAETDKDTILNPVNHLYLNLNGNGCYWEHSLFINSDRLVETDAHLLPTGSVTEIKGTRFDFRDMRQITGYYDNSYILSGGRFGPAAILKGLESCIVCVLLTDRPCMQLYNTETEICLETQAWPDAIHHESFPSVVLRPGEEFYTKTEYRFGEGEKA